MHKQAKKILDRQAAGHDLATRLQRYAHRDDVLVLGLPRGGVPVAFEVAKSLNAALDICLVRKLGVPGHQELAMGAIAAGGVRVLNQHLVRELGISEQAIEEVTAREWQELQRRDQVYRGGRPPPEIGDRTVILVDDGLATGSTMQAAIAVIKPQQPAGIVVAVPVAPAEACTAIKAGVDDVVCLLTPEPFYAIGLWYENFDQTTDQEVKALLSQQFVI
jgi:putative phosphoribosyl transferase